MIDYLLSRIVLITFLFLIAALIISYQGTVTDYFKNRAAETVLKNVITEIVSVTTNPNTAYEERIIELPKRLFTDAGGIKYYLKIAVKSSEEDMVLVGAVKDVRGNVLAVYSYTVKPYINSIEISVPDSYVEGGGYLFIRKETEYSPEQKVKVSVKYCKDIFNC